MVVAYSFSFTLNHIEILCSFFMVLSDYTRWQYFLSCA